VETLTTDRLFLRRPTAADAQAMFERYAGDPEVTRYLGWFTHQSVVDTEAFLAFSDAEWERWPAGPFLVFLRSDGRLVGSTGLGFESLHRASTGYVLARDAWGQGYATEMARVMVELASALGVERLQAVCHHEHGASRRVLEKAGFAYEGILAAHTVFPNLSATPQDVHLYACALVPPSGEGTIWSEDPA